MQSIADVYRDDDRDEKTWEKWLGKWKDNFGENFNPAQYIPFVRDVMSIIQGYDVERMDMAAVSDAVNAFKAAEKAWGGEGTKTSAYASFDLVMQGLKMLGLPASNLKRDIEDAIEGTLLQHGQWEALYALDMVKLNYEKNKGRFYDNLYYAMLDDWDAYERLYDKMLEDGFEEKTIGQGIESRMKKALGVDKVSELPARWGAPGTAEGRAWKCYAEANGETLGKTKEQIEKEEKEREKEKKKEE